MSGNIKVSGTWRNAGNVYVRVGGTWRTALQAYVNVGGSWRIWYNTTISDTFTRANTTTGLGSTESGGSLVWNSLIGNFYVSSGTAKSDNAVTAGNAGALSYITLNTPNATASVGGQSTTSGVGPAVWVSAAGSWWAAIGYNGQTNTTYTYNCNCTCNGHTVCNTCQNIAFGGPYTGDVWYSATAHDEWKVYTNVTTYSNSGSTPVANTTTNYSYAGSSTSYAGTPVTRYCTAANAADPYNTCPYTNYIGVCRSDATGSACSYDSGTLSCPNGGITNGGSTCYNCGSNVNGNTCCGTSANSCYTYTTSTYYTCATGTYYATPPSGCTSGCCTSSTSLQWTSCSSGANFGASCQGCDSGGTFGYQYSVTHGTWGYFCHYTYTYYGSGTSCAVCGSTFYSGGTANSSTGAGCDSYGFTCQTCTGGSITNNYYMQVIYATSTGAPYTVYSTSADYGTQIGNISITTSNNTLTATAYGTTGTQLGTLTATNTAGKGFGVGVVKGYSPYNQSLAGDNFTATAGALTYVPVEYLVIGGGGGGGYKGGGGAGGVLAGSFNLNSNTPQTISIGAGGIGSYSGTGGSGTNTVFGSFTAIGGGGGSGGIGATGGSGGGGGATSDINAYTSAEYAGGAGTTGQGYAGGKGGAGLPSSYLSGGGGGGGGGAGVNGQSGWPAFIGGHGGLAYQSSITGTATYYAGGGGGFGQSNGGVGGIGGTQTPGGSPPSNYGGDIPAATYATRKAGAGSGGYWWDGTQWVSSAQSADANTGSGGGGGVFGAGNGGSGIVVIAYANTYPDLVISGMTYTRSTTSRSGYKVYTFTAGAGTVQFDLSGAIISEYLLVAGGGGGGSINLSAGGYAGSGGAGGLLKGSVALALGTSYTVTVGNGGSSIGGGGSQNAGGNGGNSVLGSLTAIGGGGGGIGSYPGVGGGSAQNGYSGGSGGGAGPGGTPGSGTAGQGYAGGGDFYGSGGSGGGAGGASVMGAPGPGLSSSITGSAVTYATGGRVAQAASGSATANTGNGGAGNNYTYQNGNFAGASGVVILSYPNTYPALTTIPAGLTYSYNANLNGNRLYRFTAGTGTVIV